MPDARPENPLAKWADFASISPEELAIVGAMQAKFGNNFIDATQALINLGGKLFREHVILKRCLFILYCYASYCAALRTAMIVS